MRISYGTVARRKLIFEKLPMQEPGQFDLNLYRGDTYRWKIVLWSDDNKRIPLNLRKAEVRAEIRRRQGDDPINHFHCKVELPNIVWMRLSHAVSAELPNKGAWDLRITFDSGDVKTVLAGAVLVTAYITEPYKSDRQKRPHRGTSPLPKQPRNQKRHHPHADQDVVVDKMTRRRR